MASVPKVSGAGHPLLKDRNLLNSIKNIMYAKIQKTLFENAGWCQTATVGGISPVTADDVLGEAFVALLEYPPEKVEHSWKGLAVRIAERKTFDAIRTSKKGLRATEHRHQMRLVSGDAEKKGPDGGTEPTLFEAIPSPSPDPEAEYLELEFALTLRDLARDVLDERDREIFFAIHFSGYTRIEVGRQFDLTSQRISQIYLAAARTLYNHPDYPFKSANRPKGGTDDD